jgi:hypothetical protein
MDQFLAMAFAQLTGRESLRDIEACLRSVEQRLYHLGFRGRISRSTLADANEAHDWRIWADLAQVLIAIARPMYAREAIGADLDATVYALDSTTIDLCLSLFPWARFRRTKAAVKLHTLLDLRRPIPTFLRISTGRRHDVTILDEIVPEAGSFYVMDRGYVDFARLYAFVLSSAFYVVRCKKNVQLDRRYSRPVPLESGLLSDHTVDQAASAHQGFLWHQRKCRQDTGLDCHCDLSAGGDSEEAPWPGGQHHRVREERPRHAIARHPGRLDRD